MSILDVCLELPDRPANPVPLEPLSRPAFKLANPTLTPKECTAEIAKEWKAKTTEEKKKYTDQYTEAKKLYDIELAVGFSCPFFESIDLHASYRLPPSLSFSCLLPIDRRTKLPSPPRLPPTFPMSTWTPKPPKRTTTPRFR